MKALTSLELPAVMGTEICDNVGPDDEIFLVKMVDPKEEEAALLKEKEVKAATAKEQSRIGKWAQKIQE